MGTRNLTVVVLDGQYRVAQYGQWDGYPTGQGRVIVDFLREKYDAEAFETALRNSRFLSNDEIEDRVQMSRGRLLRDYPELHRDTAAEILEIIQNHTEGIGLENSLWFAADSLMCEWAYVVDLDAEKLEVYRGFNTEPLTANDRFFFLRDEEREDCEYHGVKKIAEWSLDDLHSVPKLFLDDEEDI